MTTSSRILTFSIGALNVVLLGVSALYTRAALQGRVPLDKPLFLAFLILGALANLTIVALLARRWAEYSLRFRLLLLYWGWFVFWFWVFAPLYFLLVLNLDVLQVKWAWFLFVWEVVGFGLVFATIGYLLFAPLERYLQRKPELSPTEAARLYERAVRFPSLAATIIIGISAAGFAIGQILVYLLAGLPVIEGIKNYGIGFTAATFLAVIYYVSTYRLLEPLRSELKQKGNLPTDSRTNVARRFAIVAILIVASSFFLYQMLIVRSYQSIVRAELATTLNEDIERDSWSSSVTADGTLVQDGDLATLQSLKVSSEDLVSIAANRQGILDDFQDQVKLIGFFTAPDGTKSIIVIPMMAYYGPLEQQAGWTFGSAFLIFLAGAAIAAFSARILTRSILDLTRSIRGLNENPKISVPKLATGDEVEVLSDALSRYVTQVQRLDDEKSEFISIASHNMRTPITELLWTIQAIERAPDHVAETTKYLPDLKISTLHLSELTETLLNAHRLDSAAQGTQITSVELVQFVRSAVAKYEPLIQQHTLSVRVDAPETMHIMSDPAMLTIIVESLLSNAITYTPDHGTITLTLASADRKTIFSCADTGIGIPPDYAKRIFTKFQRADNAVRVRPNGTGLGLYITNQAVTRLGGTIAYTSQIDEGTNFTVTLPTTSSPES